MFFLRLISIICNILSTVERPIKIPVFFSSWIRISDNVASNWCPAALPKEKNVSGGEESNSDRNALHIGRSTKVQSQNLRNQQKSRLMDGIVHPFYRLNLNKYFLVVFIENIPQSITNASQKDASRFPCSVATVTIPFLESQLIISPANLTVPLSDRTST